MRRIAASLVAMVVSALSSGIVEFGLMSILTSELVTRLDIPLMIGGMFGLAILGLPAVVTMLVFRHVVRKMGSEGSSSEGLVGGALIGVAVQLVLLIFVPPPRLESALLLATWFFGPTAIGVAIGYNVWPAKSRAESGE